MPKKKNKLVIPFVKWVGGKRQLLDEIDKYIPKHYTKYYEPFLGGGAVLFHIQPSDAVVNDTNEELINLYTVIKESPEKLILDLKKHQNDEDYFYEVRSWDRDKSKFDSLSDIEKASRIIFLNKTCYNGLFRVNNAGEFNSPFGRYKNPNIVNEVTIRAVSKFLNKNGITFYNTDYKKVLSWTRKGAFVYLDPPYDPVSDSANFTGYTSSGFDKEEQQRLKEACDKLNERGVKFLLSNSSTDFIREIYKDYEIIPVQAKRNINSKGCSRGDVTEVLVRNYDK